MPEKARAQPLARLREREARSAGGGPAFGLRQLRSPALRYSPPMPNSSLRTLVFALACLVAAGTAHAQSSSANSSIADAISAAERGQPVDAARFANDPLYGWLAYASLRRNIDTLPTDQAQSFLSRHEGQEVAATFRSVRLAALARRKHWAAIRAGWDHSQLGQASCRESVCQYVL